ncbi:transmembrane protein 170A isoform X1 [Denticeps clupeoides]|uniref:transmembrane protein 170A isoform X1 n=1 Tax=Denticeps clupeoides TaxID=299321 RepID=UPI0010A2B42D|nr:transmembrane protein 170A isoform X1 [Denticeps clupeoides]
MNVIPITFNYFCACRLLFLNAYMLAAFMWCSSALVSCMFVLFCFTEMWYGVILWTAVSSLIFHLPAALLALFTLRRHKVARFMPIAILLMGIIGPLTGGVLTSAAIAGVYKAAGKTMISLEALVFGVGQSFCIFVISFLRILATL